MKAMLLALTAALSAAFAQPTAPVEISRKSFGQMPDGRAVEALTLSNRNGVSATVITLGASLQSLILPDHKGKKADIVLGHATLGEYLTKRQFMGSSVGRVANRIAGGRFVLEGQSYQVTLNDGPNALHGGKAGFDQMLWQVAESKTGPNFAEIMLHYVSPDGDQGFPGKVDVTVMFRLDEADQLSIEYRATTDRATVVNLSSHVYWNLAGEGSPFGAMDQRLQIPADSYSPVDETLIPTGEFRPVVGSVFDFRKAHVIGERVRSGADAQIRIGRGYDHNWVVTPAPTDSLHLMAKVSDPHSGRSMELWSDQPGLQFYSGNFLDGTTRGKGGQLYRGGDAIVLEPQSFPDTVNRPAFGSVRLMPRQVYRNRMIYKFHSRR
jgi:aldose 1-epimerase